jgi:hypothetical protein
VGAASWPTAVDLRYDADGKIVATTDPFDPFGAPFGVRRRQILQAVKQYNN